MKDRVAAGLFEDLHVAEASLRLLVHVREMVIHRTPLVHLAGDFIWFSLRAFRDSAVMHLAKVYDTNKAAHSLRWYVTNESDQPEAVTAADLKRLSIQNSDVKRLMRLRHQVFAHRGTESSQKGDRELITLGNLSEDELFTLLDDGFAMLRRHAPRGLRKRIQHRDVDAVDQLIDLDVYLEGTYRIGREVRRSRPFAESDIDLFA